MKVFEKLFVGISKNRTDTTKAPLAFSVPYEDNYAGRKRELTVKNWLGECDFFARIDDPSSLKRNVTTVIENKPSRGFEFIGFASRDVTSNKFLRVYDPNGYELEISVQNAVDLITSSTIKKGVIDAELIWARDGANNVLLRTNSKEYKNAVRAPSKPKNKPRPKNVVPEVGDIVELSTYGNLYLYVGQMYRQWIGVTGIVSKNMLDRWNREEFKETGIAIKNDDRLYHTYIEIHRSYCSGHKPNEATVTDTIRTLVGPMKAVTKQNIPVPPAIADRVYRNWEQRQNFNKLTGEFSEKGEETPYWDRGPNHYYENGQADAMRISSEKFTDEVPNFSEIYPKLQWHRDWETIELEESNYDQD